MWLELIEEVSGDGSTQIQRNATSGTIPDKKTVTMAEDGRGRNADS